MPGATIVRAAFARRATFAAMAAQAILLIATSNSYGYHRDELYFRILRPGWGYLDQPPLTPLLARTTRTLLTDEAWALRIPAVIASLVSVLLVALIAREVGGDARAQALAAWGYAFAIFPLIVGHVLLTSSVDEPIWLAVLLFVIRALLRGEARPWLWAGALVGLGLYNKLLIVVLLASLAAALLVIGPRRVLWSRPVLAGSALALVLGAPNIVYQIAHGFPQLEFGRQLSAHNSADVHGSMWPLLFLMLGPPLAVVWIAGLVALWRRPSWRPIRFLVAALGFMLVAVFVMGSQPYYEFGLLSAIYAIGCTPLSGWLARAGGRGRVIAVGGLGALNAVISAAIALPLIPLDDVGGSPVPGINQTVGDTVGWPRYAAQVAAVYRALPDRGRVALIASNYGEAGALDRYGQHLPHVYSAQNQLYFQGRPPDTATTAVIVGGESYAARTLFRSCRTAGKLDNGVGVDNEEQGELIVVCAKPSGGWAAVWPKLKHED